ncbi:MAG TPA: response regulator [Candidatus Methanoperedens sp.]|nr:response regulator [Candidatus Methanoperedens sp.]
MSDFSCHCGFGEEYFTIEGDQSVCSVCGGAVTGRLTAVFDQDAVEPPAKRVLVVDDQPFFRLRIGDILAQRRHEVLEAGEGLEAVRLLARAIRAAETRPEERVSLVILDLNMPGLIDGFQTLGVLKAMDEELPVLVLTASPPTPELLRKLGQLKAKKYLNKSSKNLDELLLKNLDTL